MSLCYTTHVIEAACPGALERYVDLSRFYDRAGLRPIREELLATTARYRDHYRQAYRCLRASGALRRNLRDTADCEALRRRLEKRAGGIISREVKGSGGAGIVDARFLSGLIHRGAVTLWDTVRAQADRVYELSDSFGTAHHLLSPILRAAQAAGQPAVACRDPMEPDRLTHLILPGLSLAFVTSTAESPWPHRAYRHLRLDAMADSDALRAQRPRLRFTRKVAAALESEAVGCLAQAKAAHDELEQLYNPHVDFDGVYAAADALAQEVLAG